MECGYACQLQVVWQISLTRGSESSSPAFRVIERGHFDEFRMADPFEDHLRDAIAAFHLQIR